METSEAELLQGPPGLAHGALEGGCPRGWERGELGPRGQPETGSRTERRDRVNTVLGFEASCGERKPRVLFLSLGPRTIYWPPAP